MHNTLSYLIQRYILLASVDVYFESNFQPKASVFILYTSI